MTYICGNCGKAAETARFDHRPGCMGRTLSGGSAVRPEHVHEDAYHDSDYSQVCKCGAVRLRASGSRNWEEWHICGLCALRPAHEETHA